MKISCFSYLVWVVYAYGEMGDGSVPCRQSGDDARCCYVLGALLGRYPGEEGEGGLEGQLCARLPDSQALRVVAWDDMGPHHAI